jgi:hypothetical protein
LRGEKQALKFKINKYVNPCREPPPFEEYKCETMPTRIEAKTLLAFGLELDKINGR